jgi:hypothetical protein
MKSVFFNNLLDTAHEHAMAALWAARDIKSGLNLALDGDFVKENNE